jgi:hypothetical protein
MPGLSGLLMITELLALSIPGAMNAFDVRIHTIRRRKNKRRPFEVRWRVAGRDKSKSFLTRALADSYRAELVRPARQGLEFDPATGEPRWAVPEPAVTTWLEHAIAYADMKWPRLAPHSRASLADVLATVTLALTRPASGRPSARTLRAALYRHAFNPTRRATTTDPAVARALGWLAVEVARLRPELTAFFGCLYYAALRPEEAVALRSANLVLAPHGRG